MQLLDQEIHRFLRVQIHYGAFAFEGFGERLEHAGGRAFQANVAILDIQVRTGPDGNLFLPVASKMPFGLM